jgi:hypothetical protein
VQVDILLIRNNCNLLLFPGLGIVHTLVLEGEVLESKCFDKKNEIGLKGTFIVLYG